MDLVKIVTAFNQWYQNDKHSAQEDYYKETFTYEYLQQLSKDDFIEYFYKFADEGGRIQSGGDRTKDRFKENIIKNYEEFQKNIFEIFSDTFNLESWLGWADSFSYLGQGLSTIILNRKDKYKYAIVNEKSINGLKALGYDIKKTGALYQKYIAIYRIEKEILTHFPELDNFYIIDAMMHFIAGTEEGEKLIMQSHFGKEVTHFRNHLHDLNQILYGPPGTGKTYSTISRAVAIIENKKPELVEEEAEIDFDEVKGRYDDYVKAGQIVFTTFHQSMAYEDFIEGIKPKILELTEEESGEVTEDGELTYIVEPGIFKLICKKAKINTAPELDFDHLWASFTNKILSSREEVVFTSVRSEIKVEKEMSNPDSLKIRYKKSWDINESQGTGIFRIDKEPMRRLFDARIDVSDPKENKWGEVKNILGASRSTSYFAAYKSFYQQSKLAELFNKKDGLTPHVLIIDEINRGNISQIFGELITLIEDDKREGEKTELSATLPYSKEKFSIPSNVYIIGTMNTADRSVEALDTALRRRFSFVPKMPKPERLSTDCKGINLQALLETINNRLKILKDNDHTIGHAWLMGITDFGGLKKVFEEKILPLLQEYFYNDYEKLGLVLGEGFFNKPVTVNRESFAAFKQADELASRYYDITKLTLKDPESWKEDDFLKIYVK